MMKKINNNNFMIPFLLFLMYFLLIGWAASVSAAPLAYISNSYSNDVSVIDTATNTVTATVPVGVFPVGVAIHPSGARVYVANQSSNSVSVIDTNSNTVIAIVSVGNMPTCVAVHPNGNRVYVTNQDSLTVSVIDTTSNIVIATIPIGSRIVGVAVHPDGTKVYVTEFVNNRVSVIDTVSNTVIATVPVGSWPVGVVVHPDGTRVYVGNENSNNVSVINTASNTVIATVPVGRIPFGVAVHPNGTRVYVANIVTNDVSVIDTVSVTVIATVPVGPSPRGVAVHPDGTSVYVANYDSNNVSVIDTASNTVTISVPVGRNPFALGQFIGPLGGLCTAEVCNGIDDDCDGLIDDGVQNTYYQDADNDLYGNDAASTLACTQPSGYVSDNTDCNDGNASVNPGTTEICNNIDDTCDGQIDEYCMFPAELPRTGQTTCYDSAGAVINCAGTGQDGEIQAGVVWPNPRFIDNGDGTVTDNLTGLMWTKVANLIGWGYWQDALNYIAGMNAGTNSNFGFNDWRLPNINEMISLRDSGNYLPAFPTGHPFTNIQGDYWTSTSSTYLPRSAWHVYTFEGSVETSEKDVSGSYAWAVRSSGSGVINLPRTGQIKCYAGDSSGAEIPCAGTGQDGELQMGVSWPTPRFVDHSSGVVTDNLTSLMWTKDANLPGGGVTWQQALDYVDGMNSGIYPNFGFTDWRIPNINEIGSLPDMGKYNPALPDGHPFLNVQSNFYWSSTSRSGSPVDAWTLVMFGGSKGFVMGKSSAAGNLLWAVRGGQRIPIEVCDGIDNDGDGQIDEGLTNTYYQDADGDTYGNASMTMQSCTQPSGYVSNSSDCNDGNASINPGALELCNGIDDNCNTQVDESLTYYSYYRDADIDGYGDLASSTVACTQPIGYVSNSTDCNDSNAVINPGATEVCNSVDDNCNGQRDEGVQNTYYQDADSDTYGNASVSTQACTLPTGYITDNTDCDDTNPTINPVAVEIPNDGIDQDCNGVDLTTISKLGNISTRGMVQTGDGVMIGGFIISGSAPRSVLIRGFGPTLVDWGVAGAMANPYIELYSGQTMIATNDNWQTPIAQCDAPAVSCGTPQDIQATGKDACSVATTGCSQDSAILVTLPPGAYTAIMRGVGGGTGVGLISVDDNDTNPLSKLVNISTRGRVLTGDRVMIGGFIVGGSTSKTVLIRGFGPTLADWGVTGAMANPYIELYSGQTMIATNDNWQTPIAQCDAPAVSCGTPQDIQATGKDACSVATTGCSQDAAILVTLPPGAYTAIVRGVSGGTGVGLVGIDEIGP